MRDISLYSGKCDLGDHFYGHREHCDSEDLRDELERTKIYIGTHIVPLRIKNYKDLLPYEPYIIGVGTFNKEDGNVIRLSTRSWVDIEESQLLEGYHKALMVAYRRCKRYKTEFVPEEEAKKVSLFGVDDGILELANRVLEKGNKSSFKGIHLKSYNDLYREPLVKDMMTAGYTEKAARRFVYDK